MAGRPAPAGKGLSQMKPEVLCVLQLMPSVMEVLEERYTLHKLWLAEDRAALLDRIAPSVRGIATDGHAGASAELMAALPKLEIVGCYGVGVDSIDLGFAKEHGVVVTNTPGVLTDDVADMAIALLLDACRGISAGDRHVRTGSWLSGPMPLTRSLKGKRVGILGLGRIGRAIAERAEIFGCELCWHGPREKSDAPYPFYPDLTEMAGACDFVVVACPGGPATAGIVNREVIDALGPQGGLVNISRGSVVDEPVLVSALQDGRLGCAALDVFAAEPKVPEPLLTMENVVLQPHMGSGTVETRAAMGQLVIDNLAAHFEGRPVLTPV